MSTATRKYEDASLVLAVIDIIQANIISYAKTFLSPKCCKNDADKAHVYLRLRGMFIEGALDIEKIILSPNFNDDDLDALPTWVEELSPEGVSDVCTDYFHKVSMEAQNTMDKYAAEAADE